MASGGCDGVAAAPLTAGRSGLYLHGDGSLSPLRPTAIRLLLPGPVRRFLRSLSEFGLMLGTLFLAASLTPSLVPRHFAVQGLLSGLSFAAGYGIGEAMRWLWHWLELPPLRQSRALLLAKLAGALACLGVAAFFLWHASEWQNSIRALMEMEPVETVRPYSVAAIALAVFLAIILIVRLFLLAVRAISGWLDLHVPRRVSMLIALVLTSWVFWAIGSGVLLNAGLRALDTSYRQLDALLEDDIERPADPLMAGSPASLLRWEELGRTGRAMVAAGPARSDIEAFAGEPAMTPLRVYVGMRAGETVHERAALALAELIRVGGFERSVLVIATPTGTGWIDPASQQALEYLHRGDVATVAVQYSYLASWLALLVDPELGSETAQAVFDAIYGHWRELPSGSRPDLYLHGLSLGAYNSDRSMDLFQVIDDPFQGAFWAGPPFQTPEWRRATAQREPGSPAWLPRLRADSPVRFTAQRNHLGPAAEGDEADWEGFRIAFLQYASDPVTFFDPAAAWRPPNWMQRPYGPDVSPRLEWYPVVTMLQLLVDMMTATTTPMGYGHVYAPEHYIDGWIAVTRPPGWSAPDIARLKTMLAARLRAR